MTATVEIDNDPFATPSNDMIKLTDESRVGHLLLITPNTFHAQMATTNGNADAIDLDFIDLGLPGKKSDPIRYEGVRVFSKVIVGSLRREVGRKPVLGVLAQGEKKVGKNAPWILQTPTEPQKQIARDYIASLKDEDPFN